MVGKNHSLGFQDSLLIQCSRDRIPMSLNLSGGWENSVFSFVLTLCRLSLLKNYVIVTEIIKVPVKIADIFIAHFS